MKIAASVFFAFSLMVGLARSPANEELMPAPETGLRPETPEDQFFVAHPDLKDEGEVVEEASKLLAAEGYRSRDLQEAGERLAAKARALLAQRTPADWQRKAVQLYPALGTAGSEFNALFLKHYRELRSSTPDFENEPSWPILLAKRCDDELQAKKEGSQRSLAGPPPAAMPRSFAGPAHAAAAQSASAKGSSRSFGALLASVIGVAMLVFAVGFPGMWVFKKARIAASKHGSERAAPDVWRAALKPAAVIYMLAGLPAAIHSFMANPDLTFVDRLFVGLLVGNLFALVITLPIYGMDALWHGYQRRAVRAVSH